MNAKVTKEFMGVEDGQFHPRAIKVGETVMGECARIAIAEGWADPLEKAVQPPDNKALPGAPRNKAK